MRRLVAEDVGIARAERLRSYRHQNNVVIPVNKVQRSGVVRVLIAILFFATEMTGLDISKNAPGKHIGIGSSVGRATT